MISAILGRIDKLFMSKAYHKKRGYRIDEQSTDRVGVHLVEEAVELLAELMDGTPETVLEEVADVMILLSRVIYDKQIQPEWVEEAVVKKLNAIWVTDPKDVLTDNPGMTRQNREGSKKQDRAQAALENCFKQFTKLEGEGNPKDVLYCSFSLKYSDTFEELLFVSLNSLTKTMKECGFPGYHKLETVQDHGPANTLCMHVHAGTQ